MMPTTSGIIRLPYSKSLKSVKFMVANSQVQPMTIAKWREKMDSKKEEIHQRRDVLLLRLLKTPPQPRPKRKRVGEKSGGHKDRRQSKGARS